MGFGRGWRAGGRGIGGNGRHVALKTCLEWRAVVVVKGCSDVVKSYLTGCCDEWRRSTGSLGEFSVWSQLSGLLSKADCRGLGVGLSTSGR
jgi:hypothetical protein